MPLYTFYPYLRDAPSLSFESSELPDDNAAEAFAVGVLSRHQACAYVAVWCGEREVFARRREPVVRDGVDAS